MRRLAWPLLCMALAWATALAAHAEVARLDDSASPRSQVRSDFARARVVGERLLELPMGRIEYRLAMAPHVGRTARIFYVIPALVTGLRSPAGMQVQWRGNGVFAGGTGRPGDRVQVWNGMVRTPWMAEVFDLTLHIDPAELRLTRGSALSFESYFEIETLP
ncbi:hypothetical protein ACUTR7_28620 [Delftia sp. NA_296.1]|uniref:hypothetical protein n=1 Tax=Delftia sp. NA_296.1 TaxID=3415648 RepID=UPI0040457B16